MASSSLLAVNPEFLKLTELELQHLRPLLILFTGSMIALVTSVTKTFGHKAMTFGISVITLLLTAWSSMQLFASEPLWMFNRMFVSDGFSHFFSIVFLITGLFTLMSSVKYLDRERLQYPEYTLLLLFSVLGMMLLVGSQDLIVLFIALEIMSLAVYSLVGFRRVDRRSNEAAMKYFILGGAASAVFLYGAALIYGATGSLNLRTLVEVVKSGSMGQSPIFVMGALFLVLGFLFKTAAVPFHMWMPDVYEGAPTPITGFMTTALKAAAFATFLRVASALGIGPEGSAKVAPWISEHFGDVLWVIAVLTMLVGNAVALTQTNLKRMLAYSSIAHTGYLLVGFFGGNEGFSAMSLYLVTYAIMNLGAFVLLTALSSREDGSLNLHDLAGLQQKKPWAAFLFALFLLSMAGIPPTAGFFSKYWLFYTAVQNEEVWLVVLGVLCSAISVYYYLRVLVFMYMKEPLGSIEANPTGSGQILGFGVGPVLVLAFLGIATLQIGIFPSFWKALAEQASRHL